MEHARESGGVHFDCEGSAGEMELELFDVAFDRKDFFEGGMIMCLSRREGAALVAANVSFVFSFFEKDCAPIGITGICLENTGGGMAGDVQRGKMFSMGFEGFYSLEVVRIPWGRVFLEEGG